MSDGADTTTSTTAAATNDDGVSQQSVSKEEMLELVKAIKFAKPEASMRAVHREITTKLSVHENFEFLKDVHVNDVKKVWKKAVTAVAGKRDDAKIEETLGGLKLAEDDVLKLYTVGNGSVVALSQEYSQAAARAVAEQSTSSKEQDQQDELLANFVHVFLDVPADRSGKRPHQALINVQQSTKQKKKASKLPSDGSDICKIQVAASDDGTRHPMLLYNQDRSAQTFIHADAVGESDYDVISGLIAGKGGSGGALGRSGGAKAYFYGRKTINAMGDGNVMSINVRELAPPQSW